MRKKMGNLKKNDVVKIITGNDKGKTGKIIEVLTDSEKVKVEGINVRKKHRRPSPQEEGGIVDIEMPLHVSNVRPVHPETGDVTTFRRKTTKEGERIRYCKKTGQRID